MDNSKNGAPDIELTLTAENQKRVEAERQRDQLLAAIEALTYEHAGRYITAIHGETDVTDLVAAAIAAAKGSQA